MRITDVPRSIRCYNPQNFTDSGILNSVHGYYNCANVLLQNGAITDIGRLHLEASDISPTPVHPFIYNSSDVITRTQDRMHYMVYDWSAKEYTQLLPINDHYELFEFQSSPDDRLQLNNGTQMESWNPVERTRESVTPVGLQGLLSIDPDGSQAAVANIASGTIHILNSTDWSAIAEWVLPGTGNIKKIIFSGDSQSSLAVRKEVSVWDVATIALIKTLQTENNEFNTAAFSMDGLEILTGDSTGTVQRWNLAADEVASVTAAGEAVLFVDYRNSDTQCVFVTQTGKIYLYDFTSSEPIQTINGTLGGHSSASILLAPDEKHLVLGDRIWNVESGEMVARIGESSLLIRETKISPDGKWVAAMYEDLTVHVWTWEELLNPVSSVGNYCLYQN